MLPTKLNPKRNYSHQGAANMLLLLKSENYSVLRVVCDIRCQPYGMVHLTISHAAQKMKKKQPLRLDQVHAVIYS